MSSLLQLETYVDECTQLLKSRFDEFAASNRTLNMGHWLQCYAFDVIGYITVFPPSFSWNLFGLIYASLPSVLDS